MKKLFKQIGTVITAGLTVIFLATVASACPKGEDIYICSGKCGDGTPFGPDEMCAPDSDTAEVRWADRGGIAFCRDRGGLFMSGYKCSLPIWHREFDGDESSTSVESELIEEFTQ